MQEDLKMVTRTINPQSMSYTEITVIINVRICSQLFLPVFSIKKNTVKKFVLLRYFNFFYYK